MRPYATAAATAATVFLSALSAYAGGATLVVQKLGTGNGTVGSNPPGINCGATCSATDKTSTSFFLTANGDAGSVFSGFGGACATIGGVQPCTVQLQQDAQVEAHFSTRVAVGGYHTCAIRIDGHVLCWGRNSDGQTGNGSTTTPVVRPEEVQGINNTVVAIATGGYHSCAITLGSKVMCWGLNSDGQIGAGTWGAGHKEPAPLSVTLSSPSPAVAIASGGYHTCALVADGTVECWGSNSKGQLGTSGGSRNNPTPVTGVNSAIAISAGDDFTCAILRENNGVKCWGKIPNENPVPANPPGIPGDLSPAIAIASGVGVGEQGFFLDLGGHHACAVLSGGTAGCWGLGGAGQLGEGRFDSQDELTGVMTVKSLNNAIRIAAGAYHTCALIQGGTIQCWGHGGDGELGNGGSNDSNVPSKLSAPSGRSALGVAAGGYQSCAIMSPLPSEGPAPQVFCWGNNGDGQLGDGTRSGRSAPVQVTGL